MNIGQYKSRITISFNELHHGMMLDPYYGIEANFIVTIISDIHQKYINNADYKQLTRHYSLLPCKNEQQRQLIYLWCGLMGLARYKDKTPLDRSLKELLDNWTGGFDIRLDEFIDFLRKYSLPLPISIFPSEVDNTKRKVSLSEAEYTRACDDYFALISLEKERAELKEIPPSSVLESKQKKSEIEDIERRIAAIQKGEAIEKEEPPQERAQRLKLWFKEEQKERGSRGALTRTAKREGITRQTLSGILKRKI